MAACAAVRTALLDAVLVVPLVLLAGVALLLLGKASDTALLPNAVLLLAAESA